MEVKRYWRIVRTKLWLIALIVIAACTAAGFCSSRLIAPQYAASAELIVNQTGGNPSNPGLDVGVISSNIMLIKTYKEIIGTPRIMGEVVRQHPELHATVNELIAKVSVSSANQTQVMSVTVTDDSFERAANIANAVSTVFQQEIRTLMKLDNVSVLNLADPSEQAAPISPRPAMNVAVTFILSLMAGVGIAFLLDQLDDRLKTEEDIRTQLGIPLLADIPRMKRRHLAGSNDGQAVIPAGGKPNVTLDA